MPAKNSKIDLADVGGQCLARKVRQASRVLSAFYDEALREHGLKSSQLNLLVAIGARGGAGPADLCLWFDLEKSTVSRSAERLAASGWIESRRVEGGRQVVYHLTRTGRRRLDRALPDWKAADAEARRRLGKAGVQALDSLLEGLAPGN